MDDGYPMRFVVRRTGLSPHVIRVWERRYGAIRPKRSETNRRLYSEAEVTRLIHLRRATEVGHNIGQIARLPVERLRELASAGNPSESLGASRSVPIDDEIPDPSEALKACVPAIRALDALGLESTLHRAAVQFSRPVLIEQIVVPLLEQIGDSWRNGSLRIAHEHLATAVLRSFLGNLAEGTVPKDNSPRLVVATPAGQLHELGALIAAITAASEGWDVTYLGPNLPAEEIAGAAVQNLARAVGLSIVYPSDDPHMRPELEKFRKYLPEDLPVLIGGRGSAGYEPILRSIGAIHLADMSALRISLESLRSRD